MPEPYTPQKAFNYANYVMGHGESDHDYEARKHLEQRFGVLWNAIFRMLADLFPSWNLSSEDTLASTLLDILHIPSPDDRDKLHKPAILYGSRKKINPYKRFFSWFGDSFPRSRIVALLAFSRFLFHSQNGNREYKTLVTGIAGAFLNLDHNALYKLLERLFVCLEALMRGLTPEQMVRFKTAFEAAIVVAAAKARSCEAKTV